MKILAQCIYEDAQLLIICYIDFKLYFLFQFLFFSDLFSAQLRNSFFGAIKNGIVFYFNFCMFIVKNIEMWYIIALY